MSGKKASMSASVDFGDENSDDNITDTGNETPETSENTNQNKSDTDNSDFKPESQQQQTADDFDISDSAVVLWEDDENVFTSEGIVPKSKKTEDNSQDNDKGEPEKEKIFGKFESVEDLKNSYKELEKKLGSQSEAVKQLKDLEPVLPIMEAMLNDPNFLDVADDYFTNPSTQKEAIRKSLGLDEDYEFNLENALSDPKSDDAKVLERLTNRQTTQAKKQTKPKKEQPKISEDEKKAFMTKHGLDEDSYNNLIEEAKNYSIGLDDIYFLINKDKILSDKEKKAQEKVKEQMKKAKQVGRTSGNGGTSAQKSIEDSFMDAISNSGGGLFD